MAAAQYYENHPYATATHRPVYPEATYPPTAGGAIVSGNSRPQDGSEDSYVEEIHREFPPGVYTTAYRPHTAYRPYTSLAYDRYRDRRRTMGDMYDYYGPPRASSHRRPRDGDYYYTRDDDYRRTRKDRSRRHRRDYYSDESSTSRSPSPRRRRRRKSFTDQAVEAIGGAAAALGLKPRSRSRDRYDDRNYRGSRGRHREGRSASRSRSRSRSRGHRGSSRNELARGLTAALTAGAAEAYRARKEPGGWSGEKGKRILTAALGAGGVGGILEHSGNEKHNKRHFIESTLAGLAANHLVNGPRSKSRSRGERRTRSDSRGGFKDLASAGLLAAAGKKAYDHRSKSRGRGRSPDYYSSSDDDGRRPRRRGVSRKRSHSVSAYLSKGLAALGLTDDEDRKGHRSSRRYDSLSDDESDDHYDRNRSSRGRRHRRRDHSCDRYDRDYRDRRRDYSRDRYDGNYRDVSRTRSVSPAAIRSPSERVSLVTRHRRAAVPSHSSLSDFDSDTSSLGSSSDETRIRKKLRRKRLVTASFAAIATVNAAHEMMGSAEKRKERLKQLREGKISPEEIRKLRTKGHLKDLASLESWD